MLYAIIATDVENSLEKRLSVRPAHVERLKVLQAEGRIVLAGPHPAVDSNDPGDAGFTGSLIVAEFNSWPMPRPGPRPIPMSQRAFTPTW